MFGIDIDSQIRPSTEEILKKRDRCDAIDPGLGNLGPREVRNQTGSVGHPIEIVVMESDDHAICRDMGVSLDIAVAEFDSL
jgi:hypothetical protein